MPVVTSSSAISEPLRKKIAWRILPFIFLLYVIAYLDRANVAFAKLNMTADLGFSEAVFGFGAGIFFIGYLVLEIPGALIVEHWSARKWFARILITWGLCTVLIGFVRTPMQFYIARFLLGVAEAGFFPGLIVYFTHWFRGQDRARALAGMVMAIPFGLALGAPVSALILNLNWLGLAGWRWVFILEGLPAVVCGFITLFYLTDHPRQAGWLKPEERKAITAALEEEKNRKQALGRVTVWQAFRQRNVLLLALALCAANTGGYAFGFWLPTTIKNASGASASAAAAWCALPYACGLLAVFLSGRSSDRTGERKWHTALGQALTAVFLALSTIPGQPFPLVMFWLCLTGAAAYSWPAPFWVLPTMTLTESAAAASIGLINSIGNLGGFVGSPVFGWLRDHHFSYQTCLLFLASCYLLAAVLILGVRVRRETAEPHRA